MTLQDTMDKENTVETRNSKTMGHFLMLCVKQAVKRGGLCCGMTSCAQLLKIDPGHVMVCLLPVNCDQISLQIHHTLVQAFCHERNIPVIPITEGCHLTTLIKKVAGKVKGRRKEVMGNSDDVSCVLIQKPDKGFGLFDHKLLQLYNGYTDGGMPVPVVHVPA